MKMKSPKGATLIRMEKVTNLQKLTMSGNGGPSITVSIILPISVSDFNGILNDFGKIKEHENDIKMSLNEYLYDKEMSAVTDGEF